MDTKITIGSRAFFEGLPEFTPKDTDTLVWMSEPKGFTNYRQTSISGQSVIEWRAMPKNELLAYAVREKAKGAEFGKFIVPEFATLIGLTINELKTLYEYYENLIDVKFDYQRVIYEAYIENNAFVLTDEQRENAYAVYSAARKNDLIDAEEQ